MTKKLFTITMLVGLVFGLASCQPAPTAAPTAAPTVAPTATPAGRTTIVLADISDDPAKVIKRFQPLADYLAAHLADFGITAGEVKVAPDLDTMARWMKDGEVDLYFDSPYPALIVSDAGGRIILRRWKSGVAEYRTVLIVKKDSPFTSLGDLRGHVVAYDEPYSTTGYMLPTAHMLESGFKPVEVQSTDQAVGPDEIGYFFGYSDENTIDWVLTDKVSAGAVSDDAIPDEVKDQLTNLTETEFLPRNLVVVSSGLDASLVQSLKELLIGIDQAPEGPEILDAFQKTAKFDEVPNLAATMSRIRDLYDLVSE